MTVLFAGNEHIEEKQLWNKVNNLKGVFNEMLSSQFFIWAAVKCGSQLKGVIKLFKYP